MLAHALPLTGFERLRRTLRMASAIGAAGLVAFHGWLLAGQLADGRLADPGLALRWAIAGALVAGLMVLHRSGGSIWSRRGVAIWVLAALLHGPAVAAASSDSSGALSLPEAVATVVLQVSATAGSLALGLCILGWLIGVTPLRSGLRLAPGVAPVRPRTHSGRRPFSPRPPPHA